MQLSNTHERATDIKFVPNSDSFLLVEQNGTITQYSPSGDRAFSADHVFTLPDILLNLDCGLISLAFDPDFSTNGLLYASLCFSDTESGVVRINWDRTKNEMTVEDEIVRAGNNDTIGPHHNVGVIRFDSQENLIVPFGDKHVKLTAQDTSNTLGSILRIKPNKDGPGFEDIEDNPYYGDETIARGIYAYGFRSPWRLVIDHLDNIWIGDVGSNKFEEVNRVIAGRNYGWPDVEGPCVENCTDYENAIFYWDRSSDHPYILADSTVEATKSRASFLGLYYQSTATSNPYQNQLDSHLIYGDLCAGFIRAVHLDDDGVASKDQHIGHLPGASAWGQNPQDGYIYTAKYGDCGSHRPVANTELFRAKLKLP